MSGIVDALVEGHASIARAQFLEVDAVTSLYFERCSEDENAGRNAAVQGEFVHVEVAFVLSITEYAATRMISLGCDLRLRLHRVSAAFASGVIDLGKATALSDALANVSDDALDLIEQLLLDGADKCSSSRLKARARSLIARHDPEGARARRRRAQEDRDVRISAGVDGMSTLSEKDRHILCQNLTGTHGFKTGGPVLGVGRRSSAPLVSPAAVAARKRYREERTYRPSAALARTVRTRDGTCRFPNCGVRAENCDLDHTVPFNHENPDRGGLTTEQNLASVCRKHHRLKTWGYWTVRQIGGGQLEWVAPTGSLVVTKPRGAFCDPDVQPDEVERFRLTESHVVERLFRCHGRGVEADLEFMLDSTVAGWRRRRPARVGVEPRAAIPSHVVNEPPPF